MWPFNRKQKEAQKMWDTLRDAPDPKAMDKLITAISIGDTEAQERLFKKIMNDKIKEVTRDVLVNKETI